MLGQVSIRFTDYNELQRLIQKLDKSNVYNVVVPMNKKLIISLTKHVYIFRT